LGLHIEKVIYIKHIRDIQPDYEKANEVGNLWN